MLVPACSVGPGGSLAVCTRGKALLRGALGAGAGGAGEPRGGAGGRDPGRSGLSFCLPGTYLSGPGCFVSGGRPHRGVYGPWVDALLPAGKGYAGGLDPAGLPVDFDWDRGIADYIKRGKTSRNVPLPDGTLDMLSILYHVRSLPLTAGMTVTRPINSGKKIHPAQALVVRKETILVGGRPWSAFLIEPDVRKAGGIFKKSDKPRFLFWISADERKLPLKVVSKVWVGSFFVELTDAPAEPVAANF